MDETNPPNVGEYRKAREAAVLFDLSERGKLELTGPDAAKFLHNLSTNDVLGLPAGAGCEAFFCTVKGRVVSHLWVWHQERDGRHSYWLDLAPGQAAAILKHMTFYRLNLDVEFADRTAELAQFHVAGPQAAAVLAKADLADAFARPRTVLSVPGHDVFGPRDRALDLRRRLTAAGAQPVGLGTFEVLRVEAGTPAFGIDIDDNRLVFEVGRTSQAISYTKGCYLGQEPIVMARDRGHVNRLLLGLKLGGDSAVPAGSKVVRDGQEMGPTSSSVVSPRLGPIALAYLRRGSWEPGTPVEVETAAGRTRAVVSALPFGG